MISIVITSDPFIGSMDAKKSCFSCGKKFEKFFQMTNNLNFHLLFVVVADLAFKQN